ncbi:MAG: nucleotide exchange factor GrpE [Clostridia bacterium]|jgi:molecular chaperone GrpE|nr:nucleotide exchange factor GrpE [Clostridia bacterium]
MSKKDEKKKKEASLEKEMEKEIKEAVIEEEIKEESEDSKKAAEYLDRLQRTMAEFDNYRKRTEKETTRIYENGVMETINEMLPVLDNLERALNTESDSDDLRKGIEMVYKQFKDSLEKLGVSETPTEAFDPEMHNAVMHVEDDEYGESAIVDVMQKGYIYKERVIRYAMVKVAN